MGTWGTGSFDNDQACDFASEIEESKDLSLVEAAIEKVLAVGKDGDLDSPDAMDALVAAEVVARLLGRSGVQDAYTEGIDAWVAVKKFKPSPKLIAGAIAAIDRIVTRPSELLELWEEGGGSDPAEWKACVADLRARVRG